MAKLKVFEKDNAGNFKPDYAVQGYLNVVRSLVDANGGWNAAQNFADFLDADPNDRPDMLQQFANPPGTLPNQRQYFVTQEPGGGGAQEEISQQNCRIYAEKDRKRGPRRSRVTMPIPDDLLPRFNYLEIYAKMISDLYNGTPAIPAVPPTPANPIGIPAIPAVAADKDKCCKFMFGVMMLTRCR